MWSCPLALSCTPLASSHAAITKTFHVNTLSHFWLVKAFLPDMVERNHGHIVTICSASAFTGVGAGALGTTLSPCCRGRGGGLLIPFSPVFVVTVVLFSYCFIFFNMLHKSTGVSLSATCVCWGGG